MKPIRLSAHATGYIASRGFRLLEVEDAIRSEPWRPATQGQGRMECRKNFAYGQDWNGKSYAVKQVRPVFVEKATETVVITVTPTTFEERTMKILYDAEVDALHISFHETTVTTQHLVEGIAADYDAEGNLAGIEILDARTRFGGVETLQHISLEGINAAA